MNLTSLFNLIKKVFFIPIAYRLKDVLSQKEIDKAVDEMALLMPSQATKEHFRQEHFEGNWSGLSLTSMDGKVETMKRSLTGEYHKTDLLKALPQTSKILSKFDKYGVLQRVRILKTTPDTYVKYHIDLGETARSGIARLHIPIETNPKCEMNICGQRYFWKKGELWYGDFSLPHELWNSSISDRYHLVIDLKLSNEGIKLLPYNFIKPNIFKKFGILLVQLVCVYKNRELKGYVIEKFRAAKA